MTRLSYLSWQFRGLVQLMRLKFLLASLLVYLTALLIADPHPDWSSYPLWAGLAAVMLVQLSSGLINEYSDWEGDRFARRTFFAGGSGIIATGRASPGAALSLAIITGAMSLWCAYYLTTALADRGLFLIIVLIGLAVSWAYSVRPVRLMSTGLGELSVAVLIAFVMPALAYYYVGGELVIHWQLSLPVFFFAFAMLISVEYPDRQADIRSGKRNLVYRLGIRGAAMLQALLSFIGYGVLIWYVVTGQLSLLVGLALVMLPFVWAAATVMGLSKYYDHYQAGIATASVSYALVLLLVLMFLSVL